VAGQQPAYPLHLYKVEADSNDHDFLAAVASHDQAAAKWTRPRPDSAPRTAELSSHADNQKGAPGTTLIVQKLLHGASTKNQPAAVRYTTIPKTRAAWTERRMDTIGL
jgi:hypothetical protein